MILGMQIFKMKVSYRSHSSQSQVHLQRTLYLLGIDIEWLLIRLNGLSNGSICTYHCWRMSHVWMKRSSLVLVLLLIVVLFMTWSGVRRCW